MKKVLLLITLQFFVFQILSAQSISESLGGIKTNFKVFSDTIDLKVIDQIVVLATEKRTYISPSENAGWGYGYQSVHLEFITKKELFEMPAEGKNKNKYSIRFYDQDNIILLTINIPEYSVNKYINPFITNSRIFYSIDFIDIPLLVLDKAKGINIIKLK